MNISFIGEVFSSENFCRDYEVYLENFDAIGRFRDKDEAGLPLDTSGEVKGTKFAGIEGLRTYLVAQEAQFTNHVFRTLLGYALGRAGLGRF